MERIPEPGWFSGEPDDDRCMDLNGWPPASFRVRRRKAMEAIDFEEVNKMDRQKEDETPVFDLDDRGFNVKAWYLKDTAESKGDALVEVKYGDKLIRQFVFPAYKIFNIFAHFSDIVSGELSKNDKDRGYRIAGSMF